MNLILFTESFPFDAALETTFIAPEVRHLTACFDRVVIVPATAAGERFQLSPGVEVPVDLATRLATDVRTAGTTSRALSSRALRTELRRHPVAMTSPRAMRRALGVIARSSIVRDWTRRFMIQERMPAHDTVAYTYWWGAATLGLVELKREWPGLLVISRAHGADLYHERHTPPWIPGQATSVETIDAVFPDSDKGTEYLRRRYPSFTTKVATARMGVPEPGFRAKTSPRGSFSIVSCSLLVPVKRVELIMQGIAAAAASRPAAAFRWTHFGDGPLRESILQGSRDLPPNVSASLPGYPGLDAVMTFYREQPVDVFVNASSSEGTPVAAMEALSCGIPLLMTAVGGNTELVQGRSGVLVDADSGPQQLGTALLGVLEDDGGRLLMRDRSADLWRTHYHADTNYRSFAETLVAMRGAAGSGA